MIKDEIAIRIEKVISENFGDKELGLVEKIHLCSLLEEEFDIDINNLYNDWTNTDSIIDSIRKIISEE